MANSQTISSPFLSAGAPTVSLPNHRKISLFHHYQRSCRTSGKRVCFKIQAIKLPAGVELPKEDPKFQAPFLGFTRTAEIWNSRACMIGLVGIFIIELIMNKGILQLIGVEIGKGLDIPL